MKSRQIELRVNWGDGKYTHIAIRGRSMAAALGMCVHQPGLPGCCLEMRRASGWIRYEPAMSPSYQKRA